MFFGPGTYVIIETQLDQVQNPFHIFILPHYQFGGIHMKIKLPKTTLKYAVLLIYKLQEGPVDILFKQNGSDSPWTNLKSFVIILGSLYISFTDIQIVLSSQIWLWNTYVLLK